MVVIKEKRKDAPAEPQPVHPISNAARRVLIWFTIDLAYLHAVINNDSQKLALTSSLCVETGWWRSSILARREVPSLYLCQRVLSPSSRAPWPRRTWLRVVLYLPPTDTSTSPQSRML